MREHPPPYEGEGPFALWHYSEDPSLSRFEPRPVADPAAPAVVWAIDTRHAPGFWFPRDCPRGCIWPGAATTAADRERFFGQTATDRVHVMESAWLDRLRACRLYAYRLPAASFTRHDEVSGTGPPASPSTPGNESPVATSWPGTPRPGSNCVSPRRSGRSGIG